MIEFIRNYMIFVLILGIVVILVRKPVYRQVGSTCGFYALVYGISKIKYVRKKKTVRKIIINSILSRESYVGEVFNIEKLQKIAKKYFPDVNVEVVNINGIEDLDKYLMSNYVVFPCNHGGIPHYIFVERSDGTNYYFRQNRFNDKTSVNKDALYQMHEDLKQLTENFDWKDYFETTPNAKKYNIIISNIMKRTSDPKLFKFLNINENAKRKLLCEDVQTTPINMYGKILIIPKTKIPAK